MPVHYKEDLSILDELLAELTRAPQTETVRLSYEHIKSAHRYLFGAAWPEFRASLKEARGSLSPIGDSALKDRLKSLLARLDHA